MIVKFNRYDCEFHGCKHTILIPKDIGRTICWYTDYYSTSNGDFPGNDVVGDEQTLKSMMAAFMILYQHPEYLIYFPFKDNEETIERFEGKTEADAMESNQFEFNQLFITNNCQFKGKNWKEFLKMLKYKKPTTYRFDFKYINFEKLLAENDMYIDKDGKLEYKYFDHIPDYRSYHKPVSSTWILSIPKSCYIDAFFQLYYNNFKNERIKESTESFSGEKGGCLGFEGWVIDVRDHEHWRSKYYNDNCRGKYICSFILDLFDQDYYNNLVRSRKYNEKKQN